MNKLDVISIAKNVLKQEAEGIIETANALDRRFSAAVDMIIKTTGRVILTGMGKPGHVAGKIASTLASTGTPALFVHPAEANHGDLGMICPQDTIIMFSLSGETSELMGMVEYVCRFGIKLIAVTGNKNSILAKSANVALLLPKLKEACPNGLAPTTSTAVMLALGDAMAVALINCRQFNKENFKTLHPGGSLGKKMLQIKDLMAKGKALPLVKKEMMMDETLIEMSTKSFGCVGITNDIGKLIGIITDGDLRRNMSDNLLRLTAEKVMTPEPITINQEIMALEVVNLMNARKITAVFVVDEFGKPIGLIHIHTLLGAGIA
ncbi:MAG: KpsF/GutQ family sugar-phosphate isomerase [Holosporales bacterium]|jgi:arabinose-5-phosphate isomerase|nr:KpsF/GutQ family sugar-phosphate isomerase [Holosporales bacterium]